MRTTIQLDDELHGVVRRYAMERGKTFNAIVEESLREKLSSGPVGNISRSVKLTTVDGSGIQPGIDLDNTTALLELMEEA